MAIVYSVGIMRISVRYLCQISLSDNARTEASNAVHVLHLRNNKTNTKTIDFLLVFNKDLIDIKFSQVN